MSSLQNLPAEVLENIASFSEKWLFNLRLVSREIDTKTLHTFSKTYFSTRSIWLDQRSLADLEEISKSRLSPSILRLRFTHYQWDLAYAARIWGRSELISSEEEVEECASFYRARYDQDSLLTSAYATTVLSRTLATLHSLRSLDLADYEDTECNAEGQYLPIEAHRSRRPYQQGLRTCNSANFIGDLWTVLSTAILQSSARLESLTISVDSAYHFPAEGFMRTIPAQIPQWSVALCKLSPLKLDIEIPRTQPRRRLWQAAFISFLSVCTNLRDLFLSAAVAEEAEDDPDASHHILERMSEWPTLPKLHTLNILGSTCRSEDLWHFLRRQSNTLKKLELEETDICGGSWDDLLRRIAMDMDLDLLCISGYDLDRGDVARIDVSRPHIQDVILARIDRGIHRPMEN